MQNMEEIKQIIKENILIERLEIEDLSPEEIEDQEPLFGDGIGLDSVEALDVVAGLEEEFDVKLQGMSEEETREHFYSVETLASFVVSQHAVSM
ncbi:phosphopantetheine-binding protein [Lentibacillus cibarius]|uniref:Acyl carrier protein n=1 Tax=Lentibacillus cibarius TaxID=2583219 RepID=A0A5S3R6Q0_9BACI|nr:phosphopantetheine-binding protein [Lentibacillus cibarius]TMN20883.1 acyl carrier protein [Lentibacillus cibarius]